MTLTIGSLFSGIGGLELGLERAGLGPVRWQCEIDPYCRRVLANHWPGVRRFHDVRDVDGEAERVDLVCGGFPCQDVSDAATSRRDGLRGERSGLWWHMYRVLEAQAPRWVIVENVAGAAWKRWVPVVRRGMWSLGYAGVPIVVRASDVGAPFQGARVFVVAAAHGDGEPARAVHEKARELSQATGARGEHWRAAAPWHLGVAHGVPHRLDRLRAVGNAVVPQCAELLGRALLATEEARHAA